jgi:23S rRNA pseudouridine1911/1915/1917 synthase
VSAPIGRTGRRGGRVKLAGGRRPLEARTEVEVVERRAATTLVRAKLAKGRAHQVRVHLAHLGSPVVGDAVYGQGGGDLHLHALSVTFLHPMSGEPLRIASPPPAWATPERHS